MARILIKSGGSAIVAVAAGQKIAVSCEGTAIVSRSTYPLPVPETWAELARITAGDQAFGTYAADSRVRVEALTADAYYETGTDPAAQSAADAVTFTGAATLTNTHAGRRLICNSASPLTLTIATDAAGGFSGSDWLDIYNAGAGTVTIAGDTGVTLRNAATLAQYRATLVDRVGANEWAQP